MTHLVFVHGALANPSSWMGIPQAMRANGHTVAVPQMPRSFFPPTARLLQSYVAKLAEAVPAGRSAILVGHSMGGFTMSAFAATYPERVSHLIYVAAVLPADGQSTWDAVLGGFQLGKIQQAFRDEPALRAGLSFSSEPIWTPFSETPEFRAIPKTVLRCSEDQVISGASQQAMIDAAVASGQAVTQVDRAWDHFPQAFEPDGLEQVLVDAL